MFLNVVNFYAVFAFQDKFFGVWLRVLKIRNSTLEKRILFQKLILSYMRSNYIKF